MTHMGGSTERCMHVITKLLIPTPILFFNSDTHNLLNSRMNNVELEFESVWLLGYVIV